MSEYTFVAHGLGTVIRSIPIKDALLLPARAAGPGWRAASVKRTLRREGTHHLLHGYILGPVRWLHAPPSQILRLHPLRVLHPAHRARNRSTSTLSLLERGLGYRQAYRRCRVSF